MKPKMSSTTLPSIDECLPKHYDLFYNGGWHKPLHNSYKDTINPGSGKVVKSVAFADTADTEAALESANQAFPSWSATPPVKRGELLRKAANILREHSKELAMIDAYNTGNPVAEMLSDAGHAATVIDYFAGIIPMIKGETIPQTESSFHYTVREPLGVVARITAYNHPTLFAGAKLAAPLAAGNTVVIKPPEQAPLSCLRLAELIGNLFPPGVLSFLPGGLECGRTLASHPLVQKVSLIGSVATGRAIQRNAADTLKETVLELGGKNALVAYPDANMETLVNGVSGGMNFTWAGQSCGSMSRIFLHESIHDEVLEKITSRITANYKPGVPTDASTTMGSVISKVAHDRVLGYIDSAKNEGARLVIGGKVPTDKALKGGFFIEPTVFADVKPSMRIAREEIFGPVMSVFKWRDEDELIEMVNSVEYGLTASIFTRNVNKVYKVARRIQAGYIWINTVSQHFWGVPFGGYKQSGIGREDCLDELLSFTQVKSINVNLED